MMVWMVLIILGWIICGFLAYGFIKGGFKQQYKSFKYVGYCKFTESLCRLAGVLGPMGLIAVLLDFLFTEKLSFCLRMPEELKSGYGERII